MDVEQVLATATQPVSAMVTAIGAPEQAAAEERTWPRRLGAACRGQATSRGAAATEIDGNDRATPITAPVTVIEGWVGEVH